MSLVNYKWIYVKHLFSQLFIMFTNVNVPQSSDPRAISHKIYAHLFLCTAMNNRNSIMHSSYKFICAIFMRSNLTEMIFHQHLWTHVLIILVTGDFMSEVPSPLRIERHFLFHDWRNQSLCSISEYREAGDTVTASAMCVCNAGFQISRTVVQRQFRSWPSKVPDVLSPDSVCP